MEGGKSRGRRKGEGRWKTADGGQELGPQRMTALSDLEEDRAQTRHTRFSVEREEATPAARASPAGGRAKREELTLLRPQGR